MDSRPRLSLVVFGVGPELVSLPQFASTLSIIVLMPFSSFSSPKSCYRSDFGLTRCRRGVSLQPLRQSGLDRADSEVTGTAISAASLRSPSQRIGKTRQFAHLT